MTSVSALFQFPRERRYTIFLVKLTFYKNVNSTLAGWQWSSGPACPTSLRRLFDARGAAWIIYWVTVGRRRKLCVSAHTPAPARVTPLVNVSHVMERRGVLGRGGCWRWRGSRCGAAWVTVCVVLRRSCPVRPACGRLLFVCHKRCLYVAHIAIQLYLLTSTAR